MAGIVGTADLTRDLLAMGVRPGDGLFVHASLGAVGHVVGGPRGLVEALIAAVGPAGLIAMPGFSRDAYDPVSLDPASLGAAAPAPARHAEILAQVPGYDPRLSDVRQNGAVPEAFRHWPGVVRSPHPTSSVLMRGPEAAALAHPHDAAGWPTGPETPWARLRGRAAMRVLLIGVGWNRASALHAAESAARHRRTVTRRIKTGPGDAPWIAVPDVADDLGRLFPAAGAAFEATGAVRLGRLGGAECRLCGYDALIGFATGWLDRRNAADGVPPAGN